MAGSGSSELLDRAEYGRPIEEIETCRYDLVLCEDLRHIIRRMHAHLVFVLCEDADTRLYSKNDRVDTRRFRTGGRHRSSRPSTTSGPTATRASASSGPFPVRR